LQIGSAGIIGDRNPIDAVVRREFIASLLKEHLPAHPGFYGEMVWIMTMLEQWLRTRKETVTGLTR
jgi:hypothetical protein